MRKTAVIILLAIAANSVAAQSSATAQPAGAARSGITLDIKGQVYGGFNLMTLSTVTNETFKFGGLNSGKGYIEAQAEKDNFGGWLRLGYEFGKDFFGDFDIWWKQSDYFAFYITYNDDGHFPLDDIAGWNFFGFPGDVLGLTGYARSDAFYGGFKYGAFVKVNPIKNLEFNLGLNLFNVTNAEFMLKSLTFQAAYNFEPYGLLGFTYEGDYMTQADLNDNPVLSLYYKLPKIKSIEIETGVSYQIWDVRTTGNITVTRYHPVNLGVGAVFPFEKFSIKSRLHLSFLGYDKVVTGNNTTTENKLPFVIGLDVLPYYSFKENITGYVNAGIGLSIPNDGNVEFLWCINPYVVIGFVKRAAFYAGTAFYNTSINQNAFHFSIAIGLSITLD